MPGKTVAPRAGEIVQDGARHAIAAQDHRHTADQQRREQIAEAVGMGKRDDAEVEIASGDSHRVADLGAIGQELLAPKTNRARRGRGAGGEFQERRADSVPTRSSVQRRSDAFAKRAERPPRAAVRQIERHPLRSPGRSRATHEPPAQTGQQERQANRDGCRSRSDNFAFAKIRDLGLEARGPRLSISRKVRSDLPARVENRRRHRPLPRERFLPRRPAGRRPISSLARARGARLSSPLVSKHESGHSS